MGKSRKYNSIQCIGVDTPAAINSFPQIYSKYSIVEHLKDAIKKSGYVAPTPVQAQVIPLLMDGREVICSAPTGSGKTLAFLLPIIHQLKKPKSCGSFRALILTPTRELAKQIHREALWISHGTNLRIHHIKDVKEAAKKFNPESLLKYDILVTTPNRLSILLDSDPPLMKLDKLEWLVIDECDRLFEMGFKDQLSIIYKHCLESEKCRRAMFSATFDKHLEQWAQVQMNDLVTVIVGGKNKTTPNVEQELIEVGNEEGKLLAFRELINSGVNVPVLVFVDTIEKAKKLYDEFLYDNINIDVIHSDRNQKDRDEVIAKFRAGNIWFLVCTELMCRGIDFKGVNLVINYDFPKTFVSYIHRIGRTGRAGRKGKAITFYAEDDKRFLPAIINVMKRSGCKVPKVDLKKKKSIVKGKKSIVKGKQFKNKKTIVKE